MLYQYLKILHITAAVLLAANVLVTGFWKIYADKSNNGAIIGFSQRLVKKTDWGLTMFFGIVAGVTGYVLAIVANYDLMSISWLVWGQVTFWFALVVWLFAIVPLQKKMTRISSKFEHGGEVGEDYRKLAFYWYIAGTAFALALYINIYFMVVKPF